MDIHGILQARILEWVAILFSRASSQPRDRTGVSCIGRSILLLFNLPGKPKINPCGMPALMEITEEAKCTKETDSQTGRCISRTQGVRKVKGQKHCKNRRVVNGGRSTRILGDLGEVSSRGVVETETSMQLADEKTGYEGSRIL